MKLFRLVLIMILFFIFSNNKVYAYEYGILYFYKEDAKYTIVENAKLYTFEKTLSVEEKAFILLEELFKNENNYFTTIPENSKVLSCTFENEIITIDLSKEVLECAGNMEQEYFVQQLVNTLYSIKEISGIMVLVEGEISNLSEGIDFSYYNRLGE